VRVRTGGDAAKRVAPGLFTAPVPPARLLCQLSDFVPAPRFLFAELLLTLLLFFAGLAALVFGSSLLVQGASKMALSLGVSPLVVGLTIVAFGTSAPEVAVSVGAALNGTNDIAIGNVVGSNIFNVLFILGVSAMIVPLIVHVQFIRQEVPIMIGASVLLMALTLFDGILSRLDGVLLFGLLVAYVVFLIVQSRRQTKAANDEYSESMPEDRAWDRHWSVQLLLIAAGLALLVLGSEWLVSSSIVFARAFGVSDAVIGLTIVSIGTSLPEVATSITAAIRGERDIAVGNVVGSNTFNILGCLGLSSMVSAGGLPVASSMMNFDMWVMLAAAVACLPVFMRARVISRWEGGVFFLYYVAYAAFLVLGVKQYAALPMFAKAMQWFVIPLTVLTMLVVLVGSRRRAAAKP
jgi:cation:H+ antiporter